MSFSVNGVLLSGVDRRLSSVSESVSYIASVSKYDFPFLLPSGQDSNPELFFLLFFSRCVCVFMCVVVVGRGGQV